MEKSTDEMIQEAVDKMSQKYPEEDKSKYVDLLSRIIKDGTYPQYALGFNDEFVEMIYAYAYKLFQSGKFAEAAAAYKFLMSVSPADVRHPMALAACYHKQKDYLNALTLYFMSSVMAPNNPMPSYHASDCLIKLDDLSSAILLLRDTIARCKGPEFAKLKERAELSSQRLQKQLEEAKK